MRPRLHWAPPRGRSASPLDATPKLIAKLEGPLDVLMLIAGAALLSHLALCSIVRRGLSGTEHRALEDQLFAVPNRPLGTPNRFRLLRVRYFLPFRALPASASELEPWIRATLWAARITGLCFACASLGFVAAAFVEAGG